MVIRIPSRHQLTYVCTYWTVAAASLQLSHRKAFSLAGPQWPIYSFCLSCYFWLHFGGLAVCPVLTLTLTFSLLSLPSGLSTPALSLLQLRALQLPDIHTPYTIYTDILMVLRKPPPPRLENLNKWHARSESYSPTSSSTHSPSSQRRARPHRVPSQDSVYSPDLNTSPAFDLMPLEQAQRSPVGSPTSHPPSSWTEGLGDRPATRDGSFPAGSEAKAKGHGLPSALTPGPPGSTGESAWQPNSRDRSLTTGEVPVQLQSNNPFLKPRAADSRTSSADPNEWADRHSHATTNSDPLSQSMQNPPVMIDFDADFLFCFVFQPRAISP